MPLATKEAKIARHSDVRIVKEKPSLDEDKVKVIVARNIFNIEGKTGEEDAKKAKGPAEENVITKSTLPFTLTGTIYGGDPLSGIALIKDNSSSNMNSFFVGDKLTPEARIFEIHREKVILKVGDHREYLALETPELSRKDKRQKKAESKDSKSAYALEPPPDSYKEEGFERNGNNMVVSSDFRRKILTTDFAKVLQDAKAEPYMVGSELAGFRLTKIRQDSIYQKAGLQNGDIVKEINGVSLVDTGQAIKLLNSLRGENEIDIRLERDGAPITMNMQVK